MDRIPVFTPRYSRSSLMTFMLAEVLTRAISQINSPEQRIRQGRRYSASATPYYSDRAARYADG